MKKYFALLAASLSCSAAAGTLGGPLTLEDEGSFFVNGKVVMPQHPGVSLVTGPAAPGRITVNQMYVHYRIPARRQYGSPVGISETRTPRSSSAPSDPTRR